MLWRLRQHSLQASLAEMAAYLNHTLSGDSDKGGMLKTEKKLLEAQGPTKLRGGKPSSKQEGTGSGVCKPVWRNPGGAISWLWLQQKHKTPSGPSSFVSKSN